MAAPRKATPKTATPVAKRVVPLKIADAGPEVQALTAKWAAVLDSNDASVTSKSGTAISSPADVGAILLAVSETVSGEALATWRLIRRGSLAAHMILSGEFGDSNVSAEQFALFIGKSSSTVSNWRFYGELAVRHGLVLDQATVSDLAHVMADNTGRTAIRKMAKMEPSAKVLASMGKAIKSSANARRKAIAAPKPTATGPRANVQTQADVPKIVEGIVNGLGFLSGHGFAGVLTDEQIGHLTTAYAAFTSAVADVRAPKPGPRLSTEDKARRASVASKAGKSDREVAEAAEAASA